MSPELIPLRTEIQNHHPIPHEVTPHSLFFSEVVQGQKHPFRDGFPGMLSPTALARSRALEASFGDLYSSALPDFLQPPGDREI